MAARRNYRCIFTMPDKIASEKVALLRAYGAEVVVCPTAVDPEHPDSYYSVARRLTEATPGAFMPNQYANLHNPLAHQASTGPEVWRQTSGRITHLVASIGTGGTITGVGRYLKAQNPAVQIIGADPEGSVYSGGQGRPYLVEGIGEDFWPATYDRQHRRPGRDGVRPRQLPDGPAGDPGGGDPRRRVDVARPCGPPWRSAATSGPRR